MCVCVCDLRRYSCRRPSVVVEPRKEKEEEVVVRFGCNLSATLKVVDVKRNMIHRCRMRVPLLSSLLKVPYRGRGGGGGGGSVQRIEYNAHALLVCIHRLYTWI